MSDKFDNLTSSSLSLASPPFFSFRLFHLPFPLPFFASHSTLPPLAPILAQYAYLLYLPHTTQPDPTITAFSCLTTLYLYVHSTIQRPLERTLYVSLRIMQGSEYKHRQSAKKHRWGNQDDATYEGGDGLGPHFASGIREQWQSRRSFQRPPRMTDLGAECSFTQCVHDSKASKLF